MRLKINKEAGLRYFLKDPSGNPVTGLTYLDVQVVMIPSNDIIYIKTLDPSNWIEIGEGIYKVLYTSSEISMLGSFITKITGASIQATIREDIISSFSDEELFETIGVND